MAWSAVAAGIQAANSFFDMKRKSSSAKQALKDQYNYNLALQKDQQAYNTYMYKNRYQMQVEDLEKAGINKLYGLGTAPGVTSSAGSVGMPDYVGEKRNKQDAIMQGVQLATDWSAKRAQIKLTEQQTETEKANTQLKQLESIGQQLSNLYKKGELTYQEKQYRAQLEQTYENIAKTMEDTSKIQEERTAIERDNRWHKKHPILSEISSTMRNLNYKGGGENSAKGLQLLMKLMKL